MGAEEDDDDVERVLDEEREEAKRKKKEKRESKKKKKDKKKERKHKKKDEKMKRNEGSNIKKERDGADEDVDDESSSKKRRRDDDNNHEGTSADPHVREEKAVKMESVPTSVPSKSSNDDDKEGRDEGKGADADAEENDQQPSAKRKRKRKRKKKGGGTAEGSSVGGGGGASSANEKEGKLSSIEHTVYVEGIPFDSSEDDVRNFFVENGCRDVLQMRLPRWQDSGRLRGYGHVVFDEIASRSKALKELNGLNLGRRYLTVREPNAPRPGTTAAAAGGIAPRPQPEACRTVFVKNLPYESEEEDIVLAFRPCGKIVEGGVRLARNYTTKQCKGFAYVEFKNPEGAYAAVQKASKPFGMAVKGRPCFVDYDEGKMKGSYRTAEGKLWQSEHGSVHSTGGGRDQ